MAMREIFPVSFGCRLLEAAAFVLEIGRKFFYGYMRSGQRLIHSLFLPLISLCGILRKGHRLPILEEKRGAEPC